MKQEIYTNPELLKPENPMKKFLGELSESLKVEENKEKLMGYVKIITLLLITLGYQAKQSSQDMEIFELQRELSDLKIKMEEKIGIDELEKVMSNENEN